MPASRANHSIAQETDAQRGTAEGCVKDLYILLGSLYGSAQIFARYLAGSIPGSATKFHSMFYARFAHVWISTLFSN